MKILERNGSFTSVMFQLGQPDIPFYSIIFLTMAILNINPGNHEIFAEKSKDQFHHQINYKKNMGGNNLFFFSILFVLKEVIKNDNTFNIHLIGSEQLLVPIHYFNVRMRVC